jgi:hypothetical protein
MLAYFLYTEPISEKRKKVKEATEITKALKEVAKVLEDELNQEPVAEELMSEEAFREEPTDEQVQTCFESVSRDGSSFESSDDESTIHDVFPEPHVGPGPDKPL